MRCPISVSVFFLYNIVTLILLAYPYIAVQISRDYTVIPYSNINAAGEWVDDRVAIRFLVVGTITSASARSVFEETFVDFGILTKTTCRRVYNETICIKL